ncbi:hypothetical protein B0H19DRAFT_1071117 [Mycena capillaripes]|nr:hypothetical protein B0H19DRAFT_1071117 [Mycena capillaripes]
MASRNAWERVRGTRGDWDDGRPDVVVVEGKMREVVFRSPAVLGDPGYPVYGLSASSLRHLLADKKSRTQLTLVHSGSVEQIAALEQTPKLVWTLMLTSKLVEMPQLGSKRRKHVGLEISVFCSLPAELELHIFTLTAFLHPPSVPHMMLVARRVQIWIEPLLYGAFLVCNSKLTNRPWPLRLPPDPFIKMLKSSAGARHVRTLFFAASISKLDELLTACSDSLTHAMFYTNLEPAHLPLLARIPLQRLSAPLLRLFGGNLDFAHPMFRRLTHLDVQDRLADGDDDGCARWAELALVPCLTHVSFRDCFSGPIVEGVLARCAALHVLALVVCFKRCLLDDPGVASIAAQDLRCVVVRVTNVFEDWEEGVGGGEGGGEDYWKRADKFVERRQAGEVEDPFHTETGENDQFHYESLEGMRGTDGVGPGSEQEVMETDEVWVTR